MLLISLHSAFHRVKQDNCRRRCRRLERPLQDVQGAGGRSPHMQAIGRLYFKHLAMYSSDIVDGFKKKKNIFMPLFEEIL